MVQCFPFQPVTHKQVPFLHWPCSLHRGSHCFKLHSSPDHPGKQSQALSTQCPWGPQSRSHNSANRQGKLRFIFQPPANCIVRGTLVHASDTRSQGTTTLCWFLFFKNGISQHGKEKNGTDNFNRCNTWKHKNRLIFVKCCTNYLLYYPPMKIIIASFFNITNQHSFYENTATIGLANIKIKNSSNAVCFTSVFHPRGDRV